MSKLKKTVSEAGSQSFRFERNDRLSIAPEVMADIKKQDLDHRWLNAVELSQYGGGHKNLYVPYKVSDELRQEIGPMASFKGIGPEGFIKVHDLILGVRPRHIATAHKAEINQKRQRLNRAVESKEVARALSAEMKKLGYNGRSLTEEEEDNG